MRLLRMYTSLLGTLTTWGGWAGRGRMATRCSMLVASTHVTHTCVDDQHAAPTPPPPPPTHPHPHTQRTSPPVAVGPQPPCACRAAQRPGSAASPSHERPPCKTFTKKCSHKDTVESRLGRGPDCCPCVAWRRGLRTARMCCAACVDAPLTHLEQVGARAHSDEGVVGKQAVVAAPDAKARALDVSYDVVCHLRSGCHK